jgi:rhodanese-related sulfurtransferase
MNPVTAPPGAGQRWLWLVAIAILAIGVITVLFSKRSDTRGEPSREISVAQAVSSQEKGSFLLDVREPDEWAEAHISGSTLIPLGELGERLRQVPRDREVVVLCRSGNRSRAGRDILLAAGYTQVASMAGGLLAWKAAGHPTVAGP